MVFMFFISLKLISLIISGSFSPSTPHKSYVSMSTQPLVYNSSVVPTPASFSSCSVYALWHNRLGRPSKKVVRNVLSTSQKPDIYQ